MSHLQPSYRPNYGKNDRDFILLEGEFEFPADMNALDVFMVLRERSEMIGGVVSQEGNSNFSVYPWNGPGSFLVQAESGDVPVHQIDVMDQNGDLAEEYLVDDLKEEGEFSEKLAEAVQPADEIEDGETYRIDFSSGELVPTDEE